MKISFIEPSPQAPKGLVRIDDARIIFRNFEGRGSMYNREGDRGFSIVIPDENTKKLLVENGWNVRIKPPREDGEMPFMYLPVKVKFNGRGPNVYLKSGDALNILEEEHVGCLDRMDIFSVDLDIRPYDWEMHGDTGRTAYLQSMKVTQRISDRFFDEYQDYKQRREM